MPGFKGGAVFTNSNMTEEEKERNTVVIAPPTPVDPFSTSGGPARYFHYAPSYTASLSKRGQDMSYGVPGLMDATGNCPHCPPA